MGSIKTTAAEQMLGRHWLIWIPDNNGWVLTCSEKLARKAKRNGWGCIEFREYTGNDAIRS
ncbi:hypothetical protein LH704_11690 [Burkholderia cenocepacia]|uniref:hypothetical protein n=1 Tax=Burkholderia cenocepacia TaxID=95486 RepID=UPI001F1BA177|nr:hypothetical protein [Burkholderia cenocepacia]MCF1367318.1 hypothetical protein [Burkholderia cenocepacia]MCF1384851.1 hypothetical protein [Burkholderia cenocepacia]